MKEFALTIPGFSSPIPTPSGVNTYSASDLVKFGLGAAFVFAIFLTLFFLIFGGIDLITAGGEKQKIQNGRQKLIFAVIGLIVVLTSVLLVKVIGGIFGVQLFNTP